MNPSLNAQLRRAITLVRRWQETASSSTRAQNSAYRRLHEHLLTSQLAGEYRHGTLTIKPCLGLQITIQSLGGAGFSEAMNTRFPERP